MLLLIFAFYFVPALVVWTYVHFSFKKGATEEVPNLFALCAVITPFLNILGVLVIIVGCLVIIACRLEECIPRIKIDRDKWIKRFFRISTVCLFFSLMSCAPDPKPIEKYKGWVFVDKGFPYIFKLSYEDIILIKNKDSVKKVHVLSFDVQNLKPGDTIK